jgi:hypothetical protein
MRVARDFMKEMSFLKGDILLKVTGLKLWPDIWDFREYALLTPCRWANSQYWVTWYSDVDIA